MLSSVNSSCKSNENSSTTLRNSYKKRYQKKNDFSYLSLITDAYSHKIVGWALDTILQTKGPLAALQMAVKYLQKGKESLIHHSDRGIQYCCKEYIQLLNSHNIQISMTSQGYPGENALAERINRTIKKEFNCRAFISFDLAKAAI